MNRNFSFILQPNKYNVAMVWGWPAVSWKVHKHTNYAYIRLSWSHPEIVDHRSPCRRRVPLRLSVLFWTPHNLICVSESDRQNGVAASPVRKYTNGIQQQKHYICSYKNEISMNYIKIVFVPYQTWKLVRKLLSCEIRLSIYIYKYTLLVSNFMKYVLTQQQRKHNATRALLQRFNMSLWCVCVMWCVLFHIPLHIFNLWTTKPYQL